MGILSKLNDSGEWYTPHWVVNAAERIVGAFDLDPASSVEANEFIGASRIYTIDDDGLSKPWSGRIWLNPPYNNGTHDWSRKWLKSIESNLSNAGSFILVNANFGYNWFNELLYHELTTCCVFRDRLHFIPAGDESSEKSRRASALFYYGTMPHSFKIAFSDYGKIIE